VISPPLSVISAIIPVFQLLQVCLTQFLASFAVNFRVSAISSVASFPFSFAFHARFALAFLPSTYVFLPWPIASLLLAVA